MRRSFPASDPKYAESHDELQVTEPLRVMIADDSVGFREGIAALLSSVDGLELVGEAVDGEQAVAGALDLQPDVVLMDLHMPGRNGIEATREIVASAPHIAVLVLTMHEDDESVFSAVRVGARGYLVKGARQAELLRALRTVADGGAVFGPAIARRMIGFFAAAAAAASATPFPDLTVRELSERVGLTERQAHRVLADLVDEGYLTREKVGRRNRYHVNHDAPMRHPAVAEHEVGALLRALSRRS